MTFFSTESRRLYAEIGQAKAQANLFHSLLAETDAVLRSAWRAGTLSAEVMPDDLIQRTRSALAGRAHFPLTVTEAVDAAVDRLGDESNLAVHAGLHVGGAR